MAEPTDSEALLTLDHVEVRRGTFRLVLSDLSLTVARGELLALIGPSGAGKSTLLRLMAGLELPTAGRIVIAGQDVSRLGQRARAHLRRQIGIVPQDSELFDDCSVIENVSAPALIGGEHRSEAVERARVALQRVGLDPIQVGALRCDQLAYGERRRVVLARALANRPALLLIDEPGGIGAEASDAAPLFETLSQFCSVGVTAVVATRGPVPAGITSRAVSLVQGRLQA